MLYFFSFDPEFRFCPFCGSEQSIEPDKKCMNCKYHIVNFRGKISCNNNSGLRKINDKSYYCSLWEKEEDED